MTKRKGYNYEYEEGRIIRATEADIEVSGEIITSKTVINTIKYYYDTEGRMTKKVITPKGSAAQTIYYETGDDNTVVKFTAGGRTVTSHSKTDSFGRKTFDELQLGTGFVSRQFSYHAGAVTDEHKVNGKLKSSATTQLVSRIALSDGTTLSYGYDAEERITSVVETYTVDDVPVTNTTLYTYDALGQLLTEMVNGQVVNSMEYDNYGNIVKKNDKVYTYGNGTWEDLLTRLDGQTIEYDAQGNPIEYLGHTLSWEKGRQLKKFVKSDGTVISYTYNANGIRTSKTVGGVKHTYTLDGTKILRETWGSNTLIPLYDNEDSVCGIQYNNVPYYFIKNLQGDVIAIVNKDAETVARYSYDAWSVPTITQDSSGCQIATINPYRYRGYYFDAEIGMYYLQSRYYSCGTCRFLNADMLSMISVQDDTLANNLFAYCNNEPIKNTDNNGKVAIFITMAIGALFGLAIQWVIDMITNIIKGTKKFYKPCSSAWDYICSAAGGALAATGIGKMAAVFASAIIGTINYVLNCASNKAKVCRLELIMTFVIGLICGYIGGSGANLKRVNGVVKTSKTILKTAVSPKKIAMYTSKIKNAIVSTVVNAIRYIVSAVANTLGSAGKKYVKGLLGC